MSRAVKGFIFPLSLLTLLMVGLANAQEVTKETVIVTEPTNAEPTKSVVVTTPATAVAVPASSTTTSVSTPTSTTTTTKETVVTAPTTTQRVIVTPVPAAKEVIVAPTGFANCFTVASGWANNEWVPQHQVCTYENSPEGTSWIEGYWACTQYKISEGICTSWDWRPGHWAKTLVVY